MECSLCGNKTNKLFSVSCKNGYICKDCFKQIPSLISSRIPSVSVENLKEYLDWKNQNAQIFEEFVSTSNYGLVHLDSLHGYFAIAEEKDFYDDELKSEDVFVAPVYFLSSFLFSMEVGKQDKNMDVPVDVKLSFTLTDPSFTVSNLVVKHDECSVFINEYQEAEYSLPYRAQIFWDELINTNNRMVAGEDVHSVNLDLIKETERAKGLFMVDENYTESDLKHIRNILLKSFHPDSYDDGRAEIRTHIIQESYELLLALCKQK